MKMLTLLILMAFAMILVSVSTSAIIKRIDFINDNSQGNFSLDKYLDEANPNVNHPTESIYVGMGGTATAFRFRGLFRFNETFNMTTNSRTIPSSATILNFIIEFTFINSPYGGETPEDWRIYPVNYSWNNATTWFNFGSFGNCTGGNNSPCGNMSEYNGTKNLIQNMTPPAPMEGTRINITLDKIYSQKLFNGTLGEWGEGLIIIDTNQEGIRSGVSVISSADDTTPANRPIIYINYTTIDTTPPIINATINNTVPKRYDYINISANLSDDVELSFINWTINFTTGLVKNNYSISGTNYQFSNKTQINDTGQNTLNITFYASDTSGNTKQNSTLITVVDIIPEINISLNDTSLEFGFVVNITGNSSDDIELSFCQIIINQTGAKEYFNFSLFGISGFCSQNITIAVGIDNMINFTTWVNDTSNNINQDSYLITVGDVTSPIIHSINFSLVSIVDGNKLNLTINASDASSILQTIRFNFSNPNKQNFTRANPTDFTLPSTKDYISNYTFFSGSETSVVGIWNLTYVSVTDNSNNIIEDYPNITFEVTQAPLGGNGGTTGGAGGKQAPEIINQTIEVKVSSCGNTICEAGEDPRKCPQDCKLFTFEGIFCMPFLNCGNWKNQWFISFIVIGLIVVAAYTQYKTKKTKRPI